jgi:hypothetical protein
MRELDVKINQMNSVNVQLILTTKEFDLSSHQVLSFNQLNDYPDTPNILDFLYNLMHLHSDF